MSIVEAGSPLEMLLRRAQALPAVNAAIVSPYDELALEGAFAAAQHGLLHPVFVGDEKRIRAVAERCNRSLHGAQIVTALEGFEAAVAAHLVADGVRMIVKGNLHSHKLLRALLAEPALLRRPRLSHVVVTELPGRPTPLLISDGAVTIDPTLDEKVQIVQNAIDVAHSLGITQPRVAILAAVETVVSTMNTTLDAAAIAEMAQRGQILGGIVDGPLALDDAIRPESASAKGLHSAAAGCADILIAPDVDAGNILYKAFDVLLRARFGAIVTGATVPVVFTSRGDPVDARVFSSAIARLSMSQELF